MYNMIGGKHLLSQQNYTVSLVMSKTGDHAYLVIESLDPQGERVTQEAHLGHKLSTGGLFNSHCCGISFMGMCTK